MRAACPAVDKNTGQAHFGETIILLRIYLVGGLEHLDYVSIQLGSSSSQLLLSPSFFRGGGSTTNHGQVLKPTHGDLANLAR